MPIPPALRRLTKESAPLFHPLQQRWEEHFYMNKFIQKDYAELLGEIKQRIRSAQYEALKTVNKEKLSPLVAEIGWTHIG